MIAALGTAAALAVTGATEARPTLRATDLAPLTLRGTGFAAAERVKLLLAVGAAPDSRVVRADRRGTFRVVFRVSIGRCDEVVVQAIGARGNRAAFRHDAPHCIEP